jgi:hypothetical protein
LATSRELARGLRRPRTPEETMRRLRQPVPVTIDGAQSAATIASPHLADIAPQRECITFGAFLPAGNSEPSRRPAAHPRPALAKLLKSLPRLAPFVGCSGCWAAGRQCAFLTTHSHMSHCSRRVSCPKGVADLERDAQSRRVTCLQQVRLQGRRRHRVLRRLSRIR